MRSVSFSVPRFSSEAVELESLDGVQGGAERTYNPETVADVAAVGGAHLLGGYAAWSLEWPNVHAARYDAATWAHEWRVAARSGAEVGGIVHTNFVETRDLLDAARSNAARSVAAGASWGGRLGAGGLPLAAAMTALGDSHEWRHGSLPAAINAPLDAVADAANLGLKGPLPVFPVGGVVQGAFENLASPYIGETAARYVGLVPATVAEVGANIALGPAYTAANVVAASANVLSNSREDASVRAARLGEAAQLKGWENASYEWASARGDADFTLGDAHRTAGEMVSALNQPAGAGVSVYTPDGRGFERVDPTYSDAMSTLQSSGYTAEGLASFAPDEVVALSNDPSAFSSTPTSAEPSSFSYTSSASSAGEADATEPQPTTDPSSIHVEP